MPTHGDIRAFKEVWDRVIDPSEHHHAAGLSGARPRLFPPFEPAETNRNQRDVTAPSPCGGECEQHRRGYGTGTAPCAQIPSPTEQARSRRAIRMGDLFISLPGQRREELGRNADRASVVSKVLWRVGVISADIAIHDHSVIRRLDDCRSARTTQTAACG